MIKELNKILLFNHSPFRIKEELSINSEQAVLELMKIAFEYGQHENCDFKSWFEYYVKENEKNE